MTRFVPSVFWPYFNGFVILVWGLWSARGQLRDSPWIDRAIAFGPALYAAPMAVFGAEHLTVASQLAKMVPDWIPGHLFWAYLVGVALTMAAMAIVAKRVDRLASVMLGIMLLLFVLLIHLPGVAANPWDVRVMSVVLREIAFGTTAIAYGASQTGLAPKLSTVARCAVGASFVFFGWQYFPHPEFTPITPLGLKTPEWIPLHWLWSYGAGAALITGGATLILNWHARRTAAYLGVLIAASVLLVYIPILATNPSDIGTAMNYVADTLAIGGEAFLLAGLMEPEPLREVWDSPQEVARIHDPS